jgi:hypothetical protein
MGREQLREARLDHRGLAAAQSRNDLLVGVESDDLMTVGRETGCRDDAEMA